MNGIYGACFAAAVFGALAARAWAAPAPHDWPMFQFAPNHEAVFDGPARGFSWARRLGGKINGGLAIVDGTLYVESFDRNVYALDAASGGIRWSAKVQNIAMTAPVVADGLVVVGTGSNDPLMQTRTRVIWGRPHGDVVTAFSITNGAMVWQQRTVGEDMPTPALVRIGREDAIVFANGDNHVRALRLRDGAPLWTLATQGISTMSSAAAVGNIVYAISGVPVPGLHHDELYAVDAITGRYVWRVPIGNVDCSPTVAGGIVFVEGSGYDGARKAAFSTFNDVAGVDSRSGHMWWSWRSGWGHFTDTGSHEQAIAGLAVGGMLYQSIPATSEFAAFDAGGHTRWRIHTQAPVKMSAVLDRGKLYFGDTGNTLYVVDATTGRIVGGRQYPSYFTVSPPVIVGGTIYIANNDTVFAIPLSAL